MIEVTKMIRQTKESEIEEFAVVIRKSFATVAKEFNITKENCPTHTRFLQAKLKFKSDLGCPMLVYIDDNKILGCCVGNWLPD